MGDSCTETHLNILKRPRASTIFRGYQHDIVAMATIEAPCDEASLPGYRGKGERRNSRGTAACLEIDICPPCANSSDQSCDIPLKSNSGSTKVWYFPNLVPKAFSSSRRPGHSLSSPREGLHHCRTLTTHHVALY